MEFIVSAVRHIKRQPARSLLTMVGIGIGMIAVIFVSLIGQIGTNAINEELSSMGVDGLVVSINSDENFTFSQTDLDQIADLEQVEAVTPFVTIYTRSCMKNSEANCLIWGINEDSASVISIDLLYGRLITAEDVASGAAVCLIDESYAQIQYGRSDITGKTIEFYLDGCYQDVEIVGVIRTGGTLLQSIMGDAVPCFAYIPYTTLERFGACNDFDQIVLQPTDTADTELLSTELATLYSTGAVAVEDLNAQREQLDGMLSIVTQTLTIIGGISLLVAGLSIMTTMLVSVQERTREIGIKKAIGATDRMILQEVLVESFVLTLIGALSGIILAVVSCIIGCAVIGVEMIYDPALWVGCLLFSMMLGMVCGAYPAWRAAQLQPVEALRG